MDSWCEKAPSSTNDLRCLITLSSQGGEGDQAAEIVGGGGGREAEMWIQNNGATMRRLRVSMEAPKNLEVRLLSSAQLEVRPGQSTNLQFSIRIPGNEPGFHYAFARIESEDGLLRYGLIEIQNAGIPKFDGAAPKLDWQIGRASCRER